MKHSFSEYELQKLVDLQMRVDQLISWLKHKDESCLASTQCEMETLHGEFRNIQDIVEQRQLIRTVLECLDGEPPFEVVVHKRVAK